MPRPYVILNAAMTLDGKIATVTGDSRISCDADLDRVHRLRAESDAIMVGLGTVLADDPSLTVRRVRGRNPIRVVVDREARTPPNAKVLRGPAKTIVAVSRKAKPQRIKRLRAAGADVIVEGAEKVNLRRLLEELRSRGVRKLLLEGGSTLNWGMLEQGLVDEVRVAVAPYIAGGANAKTLVGGAGFAKVRESAELKLSRVTRVGRDLLLIYQVAGVRGAEKAR
ncbi:MAG: 2,5-diamino-6-(ribosylamino)-4(3H)-pyrimidinone 5'-phosphate reductase [Candidatus Hodarchaeaceae archaeon]|nr:2,5-diamino-6-(ribosylamino)-4(3H)-pyrimidinone 5'-phosphate reductase [Candidatus Hodarchaeaceae archaeon]